MASTSEIEKLERRCAENPHGLTFAPLAEAYRKHGDLDRALEVLRAGREVHPDYIPASIVLGRCHLDRGELPEAERAFAHVLTLDPENVIALKALAELAEREGRTVQAERWLNLLLAVDPSNDEAREQLARVRSGEPVVGETSHADLGQASADEAYEPAGAAAQVEEPVGYDMAEADIIEIEAAPQDLAEPEVIEVSASGMEPDSPAGDEPLAADESVAPDAPPMHVHEEPEITVIRAEEIVLTPADASDYRSDVADALPEVRDDAVDADAGARAEQWMETEAHDEGFEPAASALEPMPDLTGEFEPRGSNEEPTYPTAVPEPAPVVTESMAELYLRQGHRADALQIYRELAARRPDDARLASLVRDLSAEVDAAPAPAQAYAAAQTGGRSVADMLRGILAERLPAAPPQADPFPPITDDAPVLRGRDEILDDAEDQGEPTRPAEDHLTLGAVFGDEEAAARPAVAPTDPVPTHPADHGLSFDEFFGAPPIAEPDATRTPRPAPSGDPDDLDQFHAWLQGLKR
ncbi:MAG: tetratricopeptide repeat protein [Gemmatimonadota bacterium]|nr:tetratricopeptide repeat protein [Gemmatimonadota bacterium]